MIKHFIKNEFQTNKSGIAVKVALILCAVILATIGNYIAFAAALLNLFIFGYLTYMEYKDFEKSERLTNRRAS